VVAHNGAVTETGRVEAFSDGVLAIAITLLVLDLRVPVRDTLRGSLAHALAAQWPSYAAYVTSFLVIGIIWLNHHAVFQLVGRVDRMLLFLNLLLLMCVGAIPFTTSLLAEYLTAGQDARTAAVTYSGVMLGMAVAFSLLYGRAARRPDLLRDGVDPVAARASVPRFSAGVLVYLVTVAVAVISAPLCLALHFVLAVYYSFQQVTLRPGRGTARSGG
jgi:TMEM175 potassium channel family protein